MSDHALSMTVGLDRERVPLDAPSRAHLVVELRGQAPGVESDRPPLSIAFSVDVSGSMAGPPLAHVVQSVDRLVQLLEPADRVGMVAFSDAATEVVPLRPVDAETKRLVSSRARRLQAAGRTNLEAGLRRAAAMMPARVRHERQVVLLLTDGAPNVGATSPKDLAALAESLRPDLSVSTLGYGPRHQEDVLAAVATAGGGRYQFIPDPTLCELQLAQAVGAQGDVVADGLVLSLAPEDGVVVERVLGSAPVRFSTGGLVVNLPDLLEGGSRLVVAELSFDPARRRLADAEPPSSRAGRASARDGFWVLARVTVTYRRAGQREEKSLVEEVSVPVGTRQTAYRGAPDEAVGALVPAVHAKVLLARGDDARTEARALADRGQFDASGAVLRRWIQEVARAPGFVAGDGSPIAEAYELILDEAMAMERRPNAEEYSNFRKATTHSSLSAEMSSVSSSQGSIRSQAMLAHVAGPFPKAFLVVSGGPDKGKHFQLGARQTIGRTSFAEIRLNDANVSRRHTEILAQNGVFMVVDLGSTNATRVNGERIAAPHKLSPGDWIEVGSVRLVYQEEQ